MAQITVIGCGMMGTGICRPASDNGHSIRLIGTPLDREIVSSVRERHYHPTLKRNLPAEVKAFYFEEAARALEGADIVVGGVSSFGVDWFVENGLPLLKPGTILLSITKGLFPAGGKLLAFPDYYASLRPDVRFVAVGGPCTSYELFDRNQTIVDFCSRDLKAAETAADLFRNRYYHPVPTADVMGVETAVAMKNAFAACIALAIGQAEKKVGITDARILDPTMQNASSVKQEYNPQAGLFLQSTLEMRRILSVMGVPENSDSLSLGAGDLYVTVFGGRTRLLGTLLGRGLRYPEAKETLKGVTLEAVSIVDRMASYLRARFQAGEKECSPDRFPLLMHMDSLLKDSAAEDIPWEKFGK